MILTLLALLASPDTLLVIANKQASTVTIVDVPSARVIATLPTGRNPHEAAVSGNGRWGVTTDYGAQAPGSTLTIVDLHSRRVARTIELGFTRPHGIGFLPDHRTVAVTTETGQAVILVDVESGVVTGEFPTGQRVSHMVALTGDGRVGYTANIADGSISRVDLVSQSQPRILAGVGSQTEAIGITPDGREVWVGSNNTGKVLVANVEQWKVTDSLQTSGFPYRIGFTPDGRLALVTNPQSNEIHIYEARLKARLTTINTDGSPLGIAFSPDSRTAWVTLSGAGEIAEVDLASRTIRRRLPAGPAPDGIALAISTGH